MDDRAKADMAVIKTREAAVRKAIRRRDVEVDIGSFGLVQLGLCPVVADADGCLWILREQKLVLAGAVD